MTSIFSLPSKTPKTWWKKQFGATYYHLYNPVLSQSRSRDEASFIRKIVPLRPTHNILDLGCGHGRHAIELSKANLKITGLDYSDYFLKIARKEAKKNNSSVTFIKKDMRELADHNTYDVILSLYSAFGYFAHEENIDVLHRIFNALKPGGKFLIDVINAYEHVSYIKKYGKKVRPGVYKYVKKNTVDGYNLIDTDLYYEDAQLDSYHRKWQKNGKSGYFHYYMIQYTLKQYKQMLEHVGFEIQNLYGNYNESTWSKGSWRTIILCHKPASNLIDLNRISRFINLTLKSRWPETL